MPDFSDEINLGYLAASACTFFDVGGMILQDYIVSMETLAMEQRRELDRVKEEKKDLERVSQMACL